MIVLAHTKDFCPQESSFTTDPHLCVDQFDYWRALNQWWETDEIIVNIEHDVEWTDERVADLLSCPRTLCTVPFPHFRAVNKAIPFEQVYGILLHANGEHAPIDKFHWWTGASYAPEGTEWVDWSVPGFVKIAPEARIKPLRRDHWTEIEHQIAASVSGRWHVHWPAVQHHHTEVRVA